MNWIRKHKVVLSAMLTLIFTLFSLYHPALLSKDVSGKNIKSGVIQICAFTLYKGGQSVKSQNYLFHLFFIKKQLIDKYVVIQASLTGKSLNQKFRIIQLYSKYTGTSALYCILRI
jgi:hypothetical protein